MSAIDGRACALLVLSLATGCVSAGAPRGFLPDTEAAQTDAFGGWVDVRYRTPGAVARERGELIAITADSLWVLGDEHASVIATNDIVEGRVVGYDAGASTTGALTLVGTLSTISNGAFLVFTAPMWIIGGSVAASTQSKVPINDLRSVGWEEVSSFARFPQGLPAGITLASLEPKALP